MKKACIFIIYHLSRFFGALHVIPVKWQLKVQYMVATGKKLNLKHPRGFNEKLCWLKLYDHNPRYSEMADKYEAKRIVSSSIGDEFIVPCYGVWDNFEEIDLSQLPDQFVLKTTHDSGGVVICKNKNEFDWLRAKDIIKKSLRRNYYKLSFEWPYKNIKRRVLADKLLIDGERKELQDYKWWCFNGIPKVMYITNKGKLQQCEENFYDMEFRPLDIDHGFPRTIPEYKKPTCFETMKSLASKLSKGIPFIRVDFFVIEGKVYFGEFTFYDHAGLRSFKDNDWDEKLGEWIDLTNNKHSA